MNPILHAAPLMTATYQNVNAMQKANTKMWQKKSDAMVCHNEWKQLDFLPSPSPIVFLYLEQRFQYREKQSWFTIQPCGVR